MILRDRLIDAVIEREGGYVNDPSDSGGETNFGITAAVARRFNYTDDMRLLPIEKARAIYAAQYWQPIKGDQLGKISEALAEEVFDTAVNCGVSRAGQILQRALNALNNEQKVTLDVAVDGRIGPATLRGLAAYAAKRDVATLVKACNVLQGAFYIELTEKREKDEKFLYGWLKHRVNL